eukprot:scaffold5356_cov118-Isochrysis_galbana.AAC.4
MGGRGGDRGVEREDGKGQGKWEDAQRPVWSMHLEEDAGSCRRCTAGRQAPRAGKKNSQMLRSATRSCPARSRPADKQEGWWPGGRSTVTLAELKLRMGKADEQGDDEAAGRWAWHSPRPPVCPGRGLRRWQWAGPHPSDQTWSPPSPPRESAPAGVPPRPRPPGPRCPRRRTARRRLVGTSRPRPARRARRHPRRAAGLRPPPRCAGTCRGPRPGQTALG